MTARRSLLNSPLAAAVARRATPLIGMVAILLLYLPIAGLGVLSFSERPLSGIPWPLTLDWYRRLFGGDRPWVQPMLTSIGIGLVVSVLATVVAAAVARAIPFIRRPGSVILGFLSVLVLPGLLVGIAVLFTYRIMLGMPTGLWSVIFVHFIWALPFSLLCMLLVVLRFDTRLLDAAADLGASKWRQFVDVELPLLRPGITASVFFGFLLSFNELPRTSYVRGPVVTLPYYIWTASSGHSTAVALIYALSAIIMAGSFLLTIIALRILTRNDR